MDDEQLLIQCDSVLSLIRYRESSGLSEQTQTDIDLLLQQLRPRTDEIIQKNREKETHAERKRPGGR